METRKVLLTHLRQLVALVLVLDEDRSNFPTLDNSGILRAAEDLVVETVERLFPRGPVFPMPEVP